MLLKYITFLGTPSEKVTIARLLYRAHGITPDLRKWAESELDKQFSGKVIDVGCDITSGEIESLPHVIYEILQRN